MFRWGKARRRGNRCIPRVSLRLESLGPVLTFIQSCGALRIASVCFFLEQTLQSLNNTVDFSVG